MIIGIDHGYYAIKTRNCSFPAGITPCGSHEPHTRQNVLTFGGCFFVCGSGRQPIQRDKTANDNYYLLTLAAIAQELAADQLGIVHDVAARGHALRPGRAQAPAAAVNAAAGDRRRDLKSCFINRFAGDKANLVQAEAVA